MGHALYLVDHPARFSLLDLPYPLGRTWPENQKRIPLQILKKRLASGEIDPQEFEERKKLLERR